MTPTAYLVPAAGTQLLVVEVAGVYGCAGAGVGGAAETLAVSLNGIPPVPSSGLVLPAEGLVSSPRYLWLPRGARVYVRGWDNAGAPADAACTIWLLVPDEVA